MLKTFQYELRPTEMQKRQLLQVMGNVRYVYNWALSQKKEEWESAKGSVGQFELMRRLTAHKKEKEWLSLAPVHSLQKAISHLENAYQNFFEKRAEYPRYKSRKKGTGSFEIPDKSHIKYEGEKQEVFIPKVKWVRVFKDRDLQGEIRQATVKKTATGRFYISILCETGAAAPVLPIPSKTSTVGIDLGIKDFAITSDGQIFENPRHFVSSQKRLGVYQKRLSRAVKGSKNREKLKLKVARVHERVANQRRDFQHKVSTELTCSENQTTVIAMETLSAENLLKNSKLAKHISDAAWNQFKQFVEYKCSWYGKHFVQIGRFEPSSKTCSVCGWYYRDLTLKVRSWECPECGTHHDRDVNAACNIRNFGWLTLDKSLGVVDAAPSTTEAASGLLCENKAPLSGSGLPESDEVGKVRGRHA
jgi:putative transposase